MDEDAIMSLLER